MVWILLAKNDKTEQIIQNNITRKQNWTEHDSKELGFRISIENVFNSDKLAIE